MNVDEGQFRQPPGEYRPVAMWFLNGRLDDDEVRRQIDAMAAGGIGGIQVAARTGLETPYLSDAWFALVELILDTARRCGVAVWLADEYPYPSGASGGEVVLRHPEYRAWRMRASRLLASPGEAVQAIAPGSVLLRACAVPTVGGIARWADALPLETCVGLVQHDQVLFQPSRVYLTDRRYMTNGPRPTLRWCAPHGPEGWQIWLIAAAEITDYKFFGSYVDLCNPAAGKLFLATTYKRYFERLGPTKFAQLAGFFVDEAHPQNWSWQLADFFRQRNGYDLVEALPALWTDVGPQTPRVRYDFRQSITELFVESFHKPVAAWCHEHGVLLSLEVPSTRNTVQRFADVPGIDPGHDKVGVPLDEILARELANFRGNLGFPASLAAQTGRQRVLDELFHSVGWSLTLQDMKAMLDRAGARGANLFAFHAFCYTIGGLRKWDAPPSEFDQNPYWPHFGLLSAYAGRLGYALSRGRRVAPVALVDPIASIWVHLDAEDVKDDTARRILDDWTQLMRELVAAQRPHDNVDPLVLAEAAVERGHLALGAAEYQVVVLPSLTTLERGTWDKLEELVAGGGTVITCGRLPDEEVEPGCDVASRCRAAFLAPSQTGFVLAHSAAQLIELLNARFPVDLEVLPEAGETARRDFLLAQRRDEDEDLYFLANSSMHEYACDVVLRLGRADTALVDRLDLETGQSESLSTWRDAATNQLRLKLVFPRHGSHLLRVRPTAMALPAPAVLEAPIVDLDLGGEWRVQPAPHNPNVLRLDRFRFTITDDDDDPVWADAPVVEPKPLINVFQDLVRAGGAWPGGLEAAPVFGAPPKIELKLPANAWYVTSFEARHVPPETLLCIEDAAFSGSWEMWLNGHPTAREGFVARRRWSSDNREADVTAWLKQGHNQLLIRVAVHRSGDGLLSAIHLLGKFGVLHDSTGGAVLTELPVQMRWDERHRAGFPYFAGTLKLSKTVRLNAPPGPFRVRLSDDELMFAGVAELAIDGRAIGVRAWAPYVWDVPGRALANSASEVDVSVTNTLVEQLEGKRYDRHSRQVVPVPGAI